MTKQTYFSVRIDDSAGEARTMTITLQEEILFGRDPDQCTIRIYDRCVSRVHLRVRLDQNNKLMAEDAGSASGTYHGNKQLREAVEIVNGSQFLIGDTRLTFFTEEDPQNEMTIEP